MRPPQSEQRAVDAEARQLLESGAYREAADAYLALAAGRVRAGDAHEYRLAAGQALLLAGENQAVKQLLEELNGLDLSPPRRLRRDLLGAALALDERHPHEVLQLLHKDYGPNIPPHLEAALQRLRADAYTQAGNHLEAARTRVRLEIFITDAEELAANREAIWTSLDHLQPVLLEQIRPPAPDTLGGWMELVALSKRHAVDPGALAQAIQHWKQRYPGHPGTLDLAAELEESVTEAVLQPDHIALLLPFKGRFAAAAAAIRGGFLAAWYADQEQNQTISIYDTSDSGVWDSYQAAVEAGAAAVVGPLDKAAVEQLARHANLPIPTLALNKVELLPASAGETAEPGSNNLYQFSLSPEEEAVQVAGRALLDGHTRAAVLTPDTPWGKRVAAAFTDAWSNAGGIIVTRATYASTDAGQSVKELLNIDHSKLRIRYLKDRLGRDGIKSESRRRQDIDLVFLAAFPRQGRQLRPQFQFHRASHIPIYATSHIYSGNPRPKLDRDLNGIMFSDMPWVIDQEHTDTELARKIAVNWPGGASRYKRLFAFGVDAYRVIPHLERMRKHRFAYYPGVTGRLQADRQAYLHRRLIWAGFRRGHALLLETTVDAP